MRLQLSGLLKKHSGTSAVVLGHGPSLDNYKVHIEGWKRDRIVVGCNEWYYVYDTVPHYWVLANSIQTMRSDADNMNRFAGQTTVLYSDTVDLTDHAWIERNIKCDWLSYDQRHFDGIPCFVKICCKNIDPGRITMQQELQKMSGHLLHYGSGDTVLLHCISLAVIMGCNPVYVVGMDLDYGLGYASNTGGLINKVWPSDLVEYRERILGDLNRINESAKLMGTRIINLNKQSSFGTLEIGDVQ
jgi:hypothetical protein